MPLESVSHLRSPKTWSPKTQTVRTQFLFTINTANFTLALHFDILFSSPFWITGKPTIDLETHDIVVIEGEKLSIPVPFRAVPVPTVSWHKDGKEVKASDRLTMKNDHISAHLEVPKSVRADAGIYTITLENKLGSATASINVKVIGNHSLMKYQECFTCWENWLTLQC